MVSGSDYGPSGPATIVLVAAYNQTRELRLTLAALDAQTDKSFEVIVGDDGSSPPMAGLIAELQPGLSIKVSSVWQEDTGFNRAGTMNLAAREALERGAELLVILDGDCIPFRNLVSVYRARACRGEFLCGSVGILDEDISRRLDMEAVRRGAHERALSLAERLRLIQIHWGNLVSPASKLNRPRVRGGNVAACAELFRRVDGYDEVYCGFGKEDSDLRNRFRNAGARGISLWSTAIATHLSRKTTATGVRQRAPDSLYDPGKSLIRARRGMSASHPGAPLPDPSDP